jgi:hypothetical protein
MSETLKYVERCTGANHNGEAWIGFAEESKSGRTIYFNGSAYELTKGGGSPGNSFDVEAGGFYWISGVKKRGTNRHWAGSGRIMISKDAVEAFLETTGADQLDSSIYEVVESFSKTDKDRIRKLQNESPYDEDDAV